MKDTKIRIIGVLGIIVIILLCLLVGTCNKEKRTKEQLTLERLQQISTTETFTSSKVADFLELKSKDSAIIYLQGKVKFYKNQIKNGGSVSVITSTTSLDVTGKTEVTYDTIRIQDHVENNYFPVYRMTINDKWYNAKIIAKHDFTSLKIDIENEYTIVNGDESKWYQKPKPYSQVTNLNPYTKTKTLKTYQVVNNVKNKKFGVGAFVGYGIGINGLTPVVGIGVNYSIIRF